MKPYRRNRRPGNRPHTKAESERIEAAKWDGCCIPCLVWARAGNMPIEHVAKVCQYDHSKSGNIRRGHDKGFASCIWHHLGRLESDGWTHKSMREHFGPSLMDGSRLFHETYGSDDDLIALQNDILEGRGAA